MADDLQHGCVLCAHMYKLFPEQDQIDRLLRDLPYHADKALPDNIYTSRYLPYHTRDDAWLVRYLAFNLSLHDNHQFPTAYLRKVVQSKYFNKYRTEYELRLVRGQIGYLMTGQQTNELMSQGGDLRTRSSQPNCDHLFRDTVVHDLMRCGVNKHSIEAGLELSADLWRETTMYQAFCGQEYPQAHLLQTAHPEWDKATRRLLAFKQRHFAVWRQYREYQYYQDHQAIIDELGTATPNMKMPLKAVARVLTEMDKFSRLRDQRFPAVKPVKHYAQEEYVL